MILYQVIIACLGIGLLEGSEIAMLVLAASAKYKWRNAWLVTLAGLVTLAPLLGIIYLFFTIIPVSLATLLAGVIIFILGAHFFKEGFDARKEKADFEKEEEEKISPGLIGVYSAIVLEEVEAGVISISIAVTSGGAYIDALAGMVAGLLIPLIVIKILKPLIEKLPEWLIQIALGSVMMVVGLAIIIYHF